MRKMRQSNLALVLMLSGCMTPDMRKERRDCMQLLERHVKLRGICNELADDCTRLADKYKECKRARNPEPL